MSVRRDRIEVLRWRSCRWPTTVAKSDRRRHLQRYGFEEVEPRRVLSGSNAIDRLDFGNLYSEAAHNFEPGYSLNQMPLAGTGALGQSYRQPLGSGVNDPYSSQGLTFTLSVDPARQNYETVKVWGGDAPTAQMYLLNAPSTYPFLINDSTPQVFPGRFAYCTFPIPIAWTNGKTSAQVTLNFVETFDAYGGTGFHYLANGELAQPIYSAYSHTDPQFVPDAVDATGSKPTQTGQATLATLTAAQATAILQTNRQNIYTGGSNSYYTKLINRQVLSTSPGSPPLETIGLDLFTAATTWGSSGKTGAQWRSQIAVQQPQPGYTAFPDELLSVLTTTYLLPPLAGVTISGEPSQYDSTLLARIVSALDGATYMQGSDGGFPNNGDSWVGLVSNLPNAPTARSAVGSSGFLEGIDTQTIGWSIIRLLNDPTSGPAFQTYLGQSYNADLVNGGSMLRATAYERMLFNHIAYLVAYPGGAESQHMFQMSGLYASQIALEKLQALYPNASYVYSEATALNYVKMVMGLAPDTLRNLYATGTGLTNYGLSAKGIGEANGTLSGGFDGGYGLWLTMLAPNFAALAAVDLGIDATTRANIANMARSVIDAFDQFISPLDYISGSTDTFTMGPEDFITYRNNDNPNSNAASGSAGGGSAGTKVFNVNARYAASDPAGPVHDAYALRSAYLETQYGVFPATTAADTSVSRLNFLRDLPAYESTILSLVNVDPATMTPLPGEPGQPDYAWADPTTGAVAVVNNGDRLFLNANWRNKEFNNSSFTNLPPSNVARIHYTTDSVDRAAMIVLPHDSATVQSDGNLSGGMTQPWYVRYGDYLIVLNHSTGSTSAKLPLGTGVAEDLLTHTFYKLGSTVVVPSNQAAIFWLAAPAVGSGTDIGAIGVLGADSYSGATRTYTVSGSGTDIGGSTDSFHYVSTAVTGNINLVAQVISQSNSDSLAQAGLMIRDGTAGGAAFAAVVRTPGSGIRFEWRSNAGGAVTWSAAPAPLTPVWLRLTRSNGLLSAYYSTDGSTWIQIGTAQSISLPSNVKAGLAVCSHNNALLATATFGGLVVSSDGQPASTNAAPTIATPATASAGVVTGNSVNLSAVGADDGGAANLTYAWSVVGSTPVNYSGATNGSNAAKNITATFLAAGNYHFRVSISDATGFSTTSEVSVTVQQSLTSLAVSPNSGPVYLATAGTKTFTAAGVDQFGAIMPGAAITPTWSLVSGSVGSINGASGIFTAPASGGGSATVRATSGSLTATSALIVIGVFTDSKDIGGPNLSGSVTYNGSTYTVQGNGVDIWVGSDQFRYVYMPITGDATITAHVVSISNSDTALGFAKSGVMFRANLDPQSAYAFMSQTYSKGANFQWRLNNGGGPGQSYTGSGTNSGWVRLVRSANTFTSYYSSDGVNWSQNATSSQTITMGATIYVGLAVTSRNSSTINTTTFDNLSIQSTTSNATFPSDRDIGQPHPLGTYNQSNGVATIMAGGSDIWNTADAFHFAYVPITGDATITARVTSLTNTNANAKAGVMIRNTLSANSAEASMLLTPSNAVHFERRTSAGGSTVESNIAGLSIPYWVRLVRSGNSFSAYYSANGSVWLQDGSTQTITMNSTVFVGLAATSHNDGTAATALLDNITVSGTPDSAPTISGAAAISSITPTTVSLSALGADSDGGGEPNVTYSWFVQRYPMSTPAAVAFSANGTNAAKNTTATLTRAGTYVFQVTITDAGGLSAASSVSVTVDPALANIALSPAAPSIGPLGAQQFTATALDQFAQPLASQPAFTWSIVGGVGSVNQSGLYTAPATGTFASVRAASGVTSAATTISIVNQAPILANSSLPTVGTNTFVGASVPLTALGVDDSGEANLIYTWSVLGMPPAPVNIGDNSAKNTIATFSAPGNYTLQIAIADPGGQQTTATLNLAVSYLKGDLNLDGQRNIADLNLMLQALTDLSSFQTNHGLNDSDVIAVADANGDMSINNADIQAMINLLIAGGPVPAAAANSEPFATQLDGNPDASVTTMPVEQADSNTTLVAGDTAGSDAPTIHMASRSSQLHSVSGFSVPMEISEGSFSLATAVVDAQMANSNKHHSAIDGKARVTDSIRIVLLPNTGPSVGSILPNSNDSHSFSNNQIDSNSLREPIRMLQSIDHNVALASLRAVRSTRDQFSPANEDSLDELFGHWK